MKKKPTINNLKELKASGYSTLSINCLLYTSDAADEP